MNLELPPTGLNLIVGRSGFGKSTLLSLVSGLAEPTAGVITFTDLPRGEHLPSAYRLDRVELVFQFPERHFLGKTVLQELTFAWPQSPNLSPSVASSRFDCGRARRRRHVQRRLDTPVRALSGGYKRRLALAIQLVRDPHVLCLDEPLAGLDWKARSEVVHLLSQLRRDRAVVVVSHDVEEIAPVTDRAWRMGKGGELARAGLALANARAFGSAQSEFGGF